MSHILKIETIGDEPVPQYAHPGDAGLDLVANEDLILEPLSRGLCGTGIKVEIPQNHVGYVNPRSGNAIKLGLTVLNAPGTIDSGYRGEVKVILYNSNKDHSIEISKGDKIAQLVIQPYVHCEIEAVKSLSDSTRGEDGFGSTDKK